MTASVFAAMQSAKPLPLGSVLLWIGLFMTISLLAGLAVLWYRKQVLSDQTQTGSGSIMEEFRRMRDSGEMTEEEYEATKRALVSKLRGSHPSHSDKQPPTGGRIGISTPKDRIDS